MLFMCQGTPRAGLSIDDRQKVLQLFAAWVPPAGIAIEAHYLTAEGGDLVIVETGSIDALLEATAIWAPFVDYRVTPIVEATTGAESIARAESTRRTLI